MLCPTVPPLQIGADSALKAGRKEHFGIGRSTIPKLGSERPKEAAANVASMADQDAYLPSVPIYDGFVDAFVGFFVFESKRGVGSQQQRKKEARLRVARWRTGHSRCEGGGGRRPIARAQLHSGTTGKRVQPFAISSSVRDADTALAADLPS